MLKKPFLIFLLSLSIGACTTTQSTLQRKLSIGGIPQFNEYISPMTVPIQPMYKPVVMDFKYEVAINLNITENSSTTSVDQYFDMTGKYEIRRLGNLLTWDIVVKKLTTGGKTLSPNRAIIEARMLMDKFGKVQEIEATSPAFGAKLDQVEKDEFINSMKKSVQQLSFSLPKNPVRSGDPLIKVPNNVLIEMLSIDPGNIEGDLEHIIKGWGIFNEKKAMTAINDCNLGKLYR